MQLNLIKIKIPHESYHKATKICLVVAPFLVVTGLVDADAELEFRAVNNRKRAILARTCLAKS